MASSEQKVRAHGGTLRLCYAASNQCIGDSIAANDGSHRESTVEVTSAGAANAGNNDLPCLKELSLQAKARRTYDRIRSEPKAYGPGAVTTTQWKLEERFSCRQ